MARPTLSRPTRRQTGENFLDVIYRLPKVISEMVGANLPVCRDDPQVVAHHFGNFFCNHSIPEGQTIQWGAWRRNANGEGAVGSARGGRAPPLQPPPGTFPLGRVGGGEYSSYSARGS